MASKSTENPENPDALKQASDIVAAYVSNHSVKAEEIPGLLNNVYAAIAGLAEEGAAFLHRREPAVPINKSVTPDFIICLEDGKKLKMLKRYLRTHYDMSTEDYIRKWNLPADYPMTAPNYAKKRSQLAKEIGLGTTAGPKRRGAKKKAAAKKR
ncbi:MAG: MucR family transcriptional regulator [Parvularculaceae bacterium]